MRDRSKSLNTSVGSGLSNLPCVIRRAWPSQGRPRVPVPGESGLSCTPAASPGFLRGAICRSQLKRQACCVAAVLEGNGTATPEKKKDSFGALPRKFNKSQLAFAYASAFPQRYAVLATAAPGEPGGFACLQQQEGGRGR